MVDDAEQVVPTITGVLDNIAFSEDEALVRGPGIQTSSVHVHDVEAWGSWTRSNSTSGNRDGTRRKES